MKIGVGFFCSTSDSSLSTNHVIRLNRLNRENLFEVFEKNLRDFIELLKLSCSMGLTIFRLGSNFIPFASHEKFDKNWFIDIEERIRSISKYVKSLGIRITMHPGQYVVLNSPHERVIEKSLRELEYHFWVLDTLGLGDESIVVVHIGGVYGNKREAIERFVKTVRENSWLTRRLAIENDEKYFTVMDAVEIGERLELPVVFDYYHHMLNPSDFDMDRLVSTWRGVLPEFHISSKPSKVHRFGEHGEYVETSDFLSLINLWSDRGLLDIIIEAKLKEKAIARLFHELDRIGIVLRKPICYAASQNNDFNNK